MKLVLATGFACVGGEGGRVSEWVHGGGKGERAGEWVHCGGFIEDREARR